MSSAAVLGAMSRTGSGLLLMWPACTVLAISVAISAEKGSCEADDMMAEGMEEDEERAVKSEDAFAWLVEAGGAGGFRHCKRVVSE